MFQVTGILDDTPYEVQVGDDGTVHGSERVRTLLEQHADETVQVGPTGPSITVDSSPRGVLACLLGKTHVVAVDGDPPTIGPPHRPDVVM